MTQRIQTINELIIKLQELQKIGEGEKLIRMFNYDPDWFGNGLPIDLIKWDYVAEVYLMETK